MVCDVKMSKKYITIAVSCILRLPKFLQTLRNKLAKVLEKIGENTCIWHYDVACNDVTLRRLRINLRKCNYTFERALMENFSLFGDFFYGGFLMKPFLTYMAIQRIQKGGKKNTRGKLNVSFHRSTEIYCNLATLC